MSGEEIEQLVRNVKYLTDRMDMVDRVLKASNMGEDMVLVYRCQHSGLFYDGDYGPEWGRKYGIGLGPDPVSECLNSAYEERPPEITADIQRIEQIMHPLHTTKAQLDAFLMPASKVEYLIPAMEDPFLHQRAAILYAKQLVNPRSRIAGLVTRWEQLKGAVK